MNWLCQHCISYFLGECYGECDFFPKCYEELDTKVYNYYGLWLDQKDLQELFQEVF